MLTPDQTLDFDALLPTQHGAAGATRRGALKAALGVGYAAAVLPALAQTAIKTSSQGLTTGDTTFDVNGFAVPAFYAKPAQGKNLPVVLVVSEIFGVHEYIADVTRRFAQAGYLAIAPELFARQGDPGEYNEMAKLIQEVISKVPDAQAMADLDGAVRWAGANGGDVNRVGITGFCWGGRVTWLYAEHSPTLKAGVAWYGRLTGEKTVQTPSHPVDNVAQLKAPVLGLYGGQDTGIPLDTVTAMQEALAKEAARGNAAAKASTFVVYPDAPHAFHADYRPSYRAADAKDGFERLLAYFKAHGVA